MVHAKSTKKLAKVEDRIQMMVFMEYELGAKTYKFLNLMTYKVLKNSYGELRIYYSTNSY